MFNPVPLLAQKKRETKPLRSSLSFSDLERSGLKQQDATAKELNHVSLPLSAVFFNPYWYFWKWSGRAFRLF